MVALGSFFSWSFFSWFVLSVFFVHVIEQQQPFLTAYLKATTSEFLSFHLAPLLAPRPAHIAFASYGSAIAKWVNAKIYLIADVFLLVLVLALLAPFFWSVD